MRIKISARKSDLARLQAYSVGEALLKAHPQLQVEYRFKESLGDINLTDPLWKIPEKGVFTEDFYSELVSGQTDMVVHSWKDLPTEGKADTLIAATLPRADQRDLLVVKKSHFAKIQQEKSIKIFSSSPRREYNLKPFLKEALPFTLERIEFESVRGNIPTRLRKLIEDPTADGLILAKAALDRLLSAPQGEFKEVQQQLRAHLLQLEWMTLPLSVNPNAAAQGALAIEICKTRTDLQGLLAAIRDQTSFDCAQSERDILSNYGGGCHQKIGVAVLQRPYGQITLVRGLTNKNEILNRTELLPSIPPPRFFAQEMVEVTSPAHRERLVTVQIPPQTTGLFVARAEAWPEEVPFKGVVWTAGLQTWKKLAQKGIWVHGTTEAWGEQELSSVDILAGKPIQWLKLTHTDGYEAQTPTLATYRVQYEVPALPLDDKKCLYWSSGSLFRAVLDKYPHLVDKFHACGPGNTARVISQYLQERHINPTEKLHVFLNVDDWRIQCQK